MNSQSVMRARRRDRYVPRDQRFLCGMEFLSAQGCKLVRHRSHGNLFSHLLNTGVSLLDWRQPTATVRAGLCHSVYGTHAFPTASVSKTQRTALRTAIGVQAEQLVWLFCNLRRPNAMFNMVETGCLWLAWRDGRRRPISVHALQQIWVIECANLLDGQLSLPRLSRLLRFANYVSLRHPALANYLFDVLPDNFFAHLKVMRLTAFSLRSNDLLSFLRKTYEK